MSKDRHSLNYRLALVFGIFLFLFLVISGIAINVIKRTEARKASEHKVIQIGEYLLSVINMSSDDFVAYQKYFMENYSQMNIPYSFSEYSSAENHFYSLLTKDIKEGRYYDNWSINNLTPETKNAWAVYMHEYWLLTFEKAKVDFKIPYVYYLIPNEDNYTVKYMIDSERNMINKDGKPSLLLGEDFSSDPKENYVEWTAWFTGKRQSTLQQWNNSWGHTYAYYIPVVIDGVKYGMIGAEFSATAMNKEILHATLMELLVLFIIISICLALLLVYMNKKFISRIVKLESYVRKYSITKNYKIAEKIEEESQDKSEISSLGKRISEMIIEIENYMRNVFMEKMTESEETYASAREVDLLRRDALTGIRSGASFENELNKLEGDLKEGLTDFGFAYVDLNDLVKINSNYGLEQGNIAIKKLCSIFCKVFGHSPIFRVGGDDFVAILFNEDFRNAKELVATFNERLIQIDEKIEPWEDIAAAIGVAFYDPVQDTTAESVFNRAEINMKNNKKMMKARVKV